MKGAFPTHCLALLIVVLARPLVEEFAAGPASIRALSNTLFSFEARSHVDEDG